MKKEKSFNKSYNFSYNKIPITYDRHAYSRKIQKEIDFQQIEETIRKGRLVKSKSFRRKICLERYFGKTNTTISVVAYFYKKRIEVRTVWKRKGK